MIRKTLASASDDIISNLKVLAEEKEVVRRKLAATAAKLAITAKKLAVTAKEKEIVRQKLEVTAKEKEIVRRELEVTAEKLALTAKKLAATAKEKENVRHKLAATAGKLALTAEKLAVTAKEKEVVRRKLAATAARLATTAEKLAATAAKLALTAEKLAATAKEKEVVRRKLLITASEKESVRRKLVIIAEKLAATAKEKEVVRRKLVVTAEKLAATAKEKEVVRRKLAITAEKLKKSYQTLEKKVLDRTKSLEMSRAKEEAVLLSIGDGLIVTDEKGNIILINKTAEKLLNIKSREVFGKNFSETITLVDEKGVSVPPEKHPVRMALSTGTTTASTVTGAVYYHLRMDGTKFPVAITATPVILGGKVIGTIKVFRDITYEREIDKAKTEFVSLASHQLRTPLSTVNWYAEMLLEGDVGELNEKQKKYLDEVYRSNQRMVELVNALLDVSSLELGTFVIEPESIDIIELAQSVIDEQKPQVNAKKIKFSFSFDENIPIMEADPKHLRMVVQNILSNAIKYTDLGGRIKFSISLMSKNNILLKISDTGYGIPKNQQSRIFTKLFRADNVRNKDTDGTGLGLYIVKSIVENSGGKVWFKSGNKVKSKGTVFYVTLPLVVIKKHGGKRNKK
ncbi:MAG: ATP-binding protein [Candidatus Paceibacterota bacterium]|jgi:PAS domain S-box-containing protein